MRGLLAVVSPSDALAALIHEHAAFAGAFVIELATDDMDGDEPVVITVDPLGEIRVDGVCVALEGMALDGGGS